MYQDDLYRDDVTYNLINIPIETEEEFFKRGGKDYNSFLEWIDDEKKELLKEFNDSFNDNFSRFCLTKWIDEKYEV